MDIGFSAENSSKLDYVKSVKRAIAAWRAEVPRVVSYYLGEALAPVGWLVNQLIPQAAIEGALTSFDWAAKNTLTAPFASDKEDLKKCDSGANQVINFHIGIAAGEGALAGFGGILTLPFDIPAVITLALRMIRQIGVEYGYADDTEDERKFVFSIFSAAGANTQAEKAAALATAAYLMNILSKQTFKAMAARAAENIFSAQAAVIAIRNLAKQLGINLTKRKSLAAIPVMGAAVGASANGWFMREIGVAAQRLYEERWLRDHELLVDGEPAKEAEEPEPAAP